MERRPSLALYYYSLFTAIACFFLIIAGGLVTSTGSGLAVPDWPLSFGQFFPPMEGGVLYEHGHRLIAAGVGLLTTILALWLWRGQRQRPLKYLGLAALIAVLLQALLGGITVLYGLPTPVSVAHACLGQLFFCVVVCIAVLTSSTSNSQQNQLPQTGGKIQIFRILSVMTVAIIFIQLVLGAWMRHTGAALAIADFPLAFGRLIPPLDDPLVRIHFAHRLGAVLVTTSIMALAAWNFIYFRSQIPILKLSIRLVNLLLLQITLGALTVLARKPVLLATAHVAVGALILATAVVLTLRLGALNHWPWATRAYFELARPRLTLLVALTTLMGYFLASDVIASWLPVIAAVGATALLAGGASALNQYAERETDLYMRRTARRPLPSQRLEPHQALMFGLILSTVGLVALYFLTNALTAFLGLIAWLSYLFAYTPLKKKTSLALWVGTIPGAIPPLIGWAAARETLGLGAWFLFGLMVLWQIPHFLAIGQIYQEDYNRAGLRLMPAGPSKDWIINFEMLASLILLFGFSLLGFVWNLSGFYYLHTALILGSAFMTVGLVLAREKTLFAARQLFLISIIYLPLLLTALTLDRIL